MTTFAETDALEAGLDTIRQAPRTAGVVELVVRRPRENEREILEEGYLDTLEGLRGDYWFYEASRRSADGSPNPDTQVTLMSSRVIDLIAGDRERWGLAGDQLYVDLDLTPENLPPGSRFSIGDAVLEVTAVPHTGCSKFSARFGNAAVRFVNSPEGRALRLRGMNARVVEPGIVRPGDAITKL